MLECHSLPQWNPLPTQYTFVHFDDDLLQKVSLERSVTCPATFVSAELVLGQAGWTPAAPSAACRRGFEAAKRQQCPEGHRLVALLTDSYGCCDVCGRNVDAGQHTLE